MYAISWAGSLLHISVFLFFLHPIHVSVTEIEFNEKNKALEIMMRVFMDDLELTLQKTTSRDDLDVFDPANKTQVDELMREYLKNHFKISLDGKTQKLSYLGHERESDAFIFYIEVTGIKKWKTIEIFNDIITETHEDQSNLVHVTVSEKVKSLRLTRDTPANRLTFDTK